MKLDYLTARLNNEVIGSGIIISSDGYIITNLHVIEGTRMLRLRWIMVRFTQHL